MKGIDYFSWFVLLVIIGAFVYVFVFMGSWPGKVAKREDHPQAKAIKIAGWVTLLAGFALWPAVVIWAYYRTAEQRAGDGAEKSSSGAGDAAARLALLEERIASLEAHPEREAAQ